MEEAKKKENSLRELEKKKSDQTRTDDPNTNTEKQKKDKTEDTDSIKYHDNLVRASLLTYTKQIETLNCLQWNPFGIRNVPSSGVEINTLMLRFTLSGGLSSCDGLLSGWPLKRGFTVYNFIRNIHFILL